ncbi:MAG: ISL3 family transposase [candidate division Zixibacteria bacterium]|nr:ISL3 family transposase [candidate division Zixibacteria bacterium]
MKDKDLYGQILGLSSPWYVADVSLRLGKGMVKIYVAVEEGAQLCCPVCGKASPGYDKRKRKWRHLDTCQFKTMIEAEVPRIKCPDHGVHQVTVPWAENGSRFTALMEALVISWLKEASIHAVSGLMDLTWTEVDGIMKRAVKRGLSRRQASTAKRLSVDETSFQKRHEYVTVVTSQDDGAVVYVGNGRSQSCLDDYYSGLSVKQLNSLEAVCMDMWPAYMASTREHVPDADLKIAFDKFHVAKHLGDAVNKVRREEHKKLMKEGRDELKNTRYLWLINPENMTREKWRDFKSLRESSLKTARAWAIKETAMRLWHYQSRSWAIKAWTSCINWAMRSKLEPVKKVARLIREHLWGIINAIVLKANNARAESMNAKIQKIKARACGFRNRDRFRNAIYFHLGGLNLYPDSVEAI